MDNIKAIASVGRALALSMERLEINDCEGEESPALEAIADAEMAFRVQLLPLIEAAPAMISALQWALGALEKCPPPKEKRRCLDTVAARAWHCRAKGDIRAILARIDGAPTT